MKSSPCLTKQPAVKVHLTRLSYGWSGSCAAIAHPEAIQTRRSFNREAVGSMAMLDCRRAYLYNSVEFISLNFYIYIYNDTYIHTDRHTYIHTNDYINSLVAMEKIYERQYVVIFIMPCKSVVTARRLFVNCHGFAWPFWPPALWLLHQLRLQRGIWVGRISRWQWKVTQSVRWFFDYSHFKCRILIKTMVVISILKPWVSGMGNPF